MPRVNAALYSLNGGEVGDEALARLDLERLQFAGSLYSNILPRVIGSMTLRPGLEYITDIDFGDVALMEFANSDSSRLLPIFSDEEMRVIKDEAFVTRASVSTAITNGDFSSFTGWTDSSAGNATAAASGSQLILIATTQDRSSATQTVSVAGGDQGVEHGLRIDVANGPVSVSLGSTVGGSDLISAIDLDDGVHSIAFTPTGSSIYLDLWSNRNRSILVNSCQIDAGGTLVIPTPWTDTDLADNILRYKQNRDVVYVASNVYQQREVQRRSDTSWGIQRYKVDDGPFTVSDGTISIAPDGFTGNITLTTNKSHFNANMIGRLYRLAQGGQAVVEAFSTDPVEGDYIRVSGVGESSRSFAYSIIGTWTGTIRLQVAVDDGAGNPSSWSDYATAPGGGAFTTNATGSLIDDDENVIKYFRFAILTSELTSGSATVTLTYTGGSRTGVVRITGTNTDTEATAEVLSRLYSLNATFEWDYSTWSDYDGWPAAVEIFGGRLFWDKLGTAYGSVPDAYKSYDDTIDGDAAPIVRSINSSAQRGALWLLSLQRLMAGTDISEISIKASGFDEPLTATAWSPVDASTRGSANLRAVKGDKDGIFVQASGTALFRLALDSAGYDYNATDLTAVHEEICDGSQIVDFAVQRRPDTIIWLALANGEARALTYEPAENVVAWSRAVTDGEFKRVAVSRGAGEDRVYFAIDRDGTQTLERMAKLSECRGGAMNCLADSFKRFELGAPQTTFSVPHLDGKDVVVWADGVAVHDQDNLYTVTSNQVVLTEAAAESVVIGLPYTGKWQSTKLAYGAAGGTALFQYKRVAQLGLYLVRTVLDGLRVGYSFDVLRRLTTTKNGTAIAAGTLHSTFDVDMMSVSSDWSPDSRVCLEAKAPYPFTAAAMVLGLDTNG